MMFPSVGPQEKEKRGSCEGKPRERSKENYPHAADGKLRARSRL